MKLPYESFSHRFGIQVERIRFSQNANIFIVDQNSVPGARQRTPYIHPVGPSPNARWVSEQSASPKALPKFEARRVCLSFRSVFPGIAVS